jgi:predicted DNA-binding transcriptional regulator YafY
VRADRLVATLLLLQSRGRVTAAEVADELEVSERTARRDLEALAMAGIPVYSQQGRGGGWSLLGGSRTDLSGLTAAEAQALFLVAGPSSAVTPEVRAALRKLVRALPEPFRADAEAASAAVVVDPSSWGRTTRSWTPPHLPALQRAVVAGEVVRLGYTGRDGTSSERAVHPLGLVTKGSVWYLIADTAAGLRTFRVGRVSSVEPTGEPVVRPEGFDLAETWRAIAEEVDEKRAPFRARALVDCQLIGVVRANFGTRLQVLGDAPDGRIEVDVGGQDGWILAAELAGYGNRIEVVSPPPVRARLAELAAELRAMYGPGPQAPAGDTGDVGHARDTADAGEARDAGEAGKTGGAAVSSGSGPRPRRR